MANINKKYNIENPDINPFAGTNLDSEAENTRWDKDPSNTYNTYKNTVYKHDDNNGWKPDPSVKNGDYPSAAGVRNQMDLTSTIKIFQNGDKYTFNYTINHNCFKLDYILSDTILTIPKK